MITTRTPSLIGSPRKFCLRVWFTSWCLTCLILVLLKLPITCGNKSSTRSKVRPLERVDLIDVDTVEYGFVSNATWVPPEDWKFTANALSASQNMFVIEDFKCTNINTKEDVCAKIRNAYDNAGQRITAVLDIKSPISVQVNIRRFCESKLSRLCKSNTLGQASAASYWAMEGFEENSIDPNYMYPQALVKQLGVQFAFSKFDIIAEHNSDRRSSVWFQEDGPIKSNQYEFEYIVLHELLHGLGFASSWNKYVDGFNMITPPLKEDENGSGKLMGFRKLNIFDKYLVTGKENLHLSNYEKLMIESTNAMSSLPKLEWMKAFGQTSGGLAAQTLFSYVTVSNGLIFSFPNEEVDSWSNETDSENVTGSAIETGLSLYSPAPFTRGSSISHFDSEKYKGTSEFLMRPSAETGAQLDRPELGLVAGAFGPGILKVFRALGYKLKEDPQFAPRSAPQVITSACRTLRSNFSWKYSLILVTINLSFTFVRSP
ncbi:hypothetical protein K7432_000879 [Basidiobolus ranarum]|uniref:Sequence orphan n=1 Tax=Basidiobolus ranarum TaxID=34480 RepID=A0ABR2X418_9FUNG